MKQKSSTKTTRKRKEPDAPVVRGGDTDGNEQDAEIMREHYDDEGQPCMR